MVLIKLYSLVFIVAVVYAYPYAKHDLSKIFTFPDKSSGKALSDWLKSQQGNPEEQGNYFEGDIILNLRNGIRLPTLLWENGIVPYKIIGSFTAAQKNVISDAIDQIQKNTCIKFQPRAGQKHYVEIDNKNAGCYSPVGRVGGNQVVNLQDGCLIKIGTVIHELLHTIGYWHEQSRSDRDSYVKILTENIAHDRHVNFEKLGVGEDENFGVSYDYGSVLHYSPTAFTSNGKPTIRALKKDTKSNEMGQRDKLSDSDIQKIRKMYKCK